jgi:hypothetical protein
MNRKWFTLAEQVGNWASDVYMLPGQLVTTAVGSVLGSVIGDNEFILSVLISTLVWLLLTAVVIKVLDIVRHAAGKTRTAIVSRIFNARTKLTRLQHSPKVRDQSTGAESGTEIHFDNLDLAVLNSAATLEPGFALTAPDLANEFKLRPPQVQKSLEKLAVNMMLERSVAAPDDYQAYRLSRAGAAFLDMWKSDRA